MHKKLRSLLFTSLASLAVAHAYAGGAPIPLFPLGEPYPGGLVAWGGTDLKETPQSITIRNQRNLGFARWFVTHQPLPASTADSWKGGELRMEIKPAANPSDVTVIASWRGSISSGEFGPESRGHGTLTKDWTTVSVPVPEIAGIQSTYLTGILFKIEPAAEYQIRKIEIVPAAAGKVAAQVTPPARGPLPAGSAGQKADEPAMKPGPNGYPDPGFIAQHERLVEQARRGNIDCAFFGDSITLGWGGQQEILQRHLGAFHPAAFGIGGDWTQHLLWRLENGELEGMDPKVIVLMIGTNNANGHKAEQTSAGIAKVVETIQAKKPAAKILLLAIFPRGEKPNPYRALNEQVNASISTLADNQRVFFLDIGSRFLEPDGTLKPEIAPDFLHFSAKGYEIWGEAVAPKIAELAK